MPDNERGNFISEWFGHRIFPVVSSSPPAFADQSTRRCPFLSRVKETDQECIKSDASKGVCTISCCSNGPRQDWVVCPYRVFDPLLIDTVAARLYGGTDPRRIHAFAAPTLAHQDVRDTVIRSLRGGDRALVYFDQKIGGEISLPATQTSPEMAFDVTLVEFKLDGQDVYLGKFGILEVQTMDFHGSYRSAVQKVRNALELHPSDFAEVLQANRWWAGDGIEGPNIANVFKRTFYQMIFKFNFGLNEACAGTVLTIPESVWDSWQPFLAAPQLNEQPDGTLRLLGPDLSESSSRIPAWIFVFDFDTASSRTPSPLRFTKTIGVTADAFGYYALKAAPQAASQQLMSNVGIYPTLQRRLRAYWPDQAMGVMA